MNALLIFLVFGPLIYDTCFAKLSCIDVILPIKTIPMLSLEVKIGGILFLFSSKYEIE